MGKSSKAKKERKLMESLAERVGNATDVCIKNTIQILTNTFQVNPNIKSQELDLIVNTLVSASARTILDQVFKELKENSLIIDYEEENIVEFISDAQEVPIAVTPKQAKQLEW